MNSRIIKYFSTNYSQCYGISLVNEQKDILGVLYASNSPGIPEDYSLSLSLIDVQHPENESIVMYNNNFPGKSFTMSGLLCYDLLQKCWVIAQFQHESYLAFRTVMLGDDGSLKLSPLCLLDEDGGDEGLFPFLGLEVIDGCYRFLYHKGVTNHMRANLITKLDVVLQRPAWDALEEQAVSINVSMDRDPQTASRERSLTVQEMHNHMLQSSQSALLDGHRTPALTITSQTVIAEAENALISTNQPMRLLVLFSPETWVEPRMSSPSSDHHTEEQWRLWLTAWDSSWEKMLWTYSPDLGLPTDPSLPTWESPPFPEAYVAMITGPSLPVQASGTFVMAVAMLHQEEVLSHGVCVDDTGQVVQVCTSPLGLRPTLCCCAEMIVGVDQFEGQWRLWNWNVLQHNDLQTVLSLDTTCQRAYVHAEPDSARFWLIEDLSDGLRVSHRDSSTLAEIAPAASLEGAHLLPNEEEWRPLDGHRAVGIIPYQETLLLLAKSADGELVLYQIQ